MLYKMYFDNQSNTYVGGVNKSPLNMQESSVV